MRRKRVENSSDTRFVQKSTLSKSECKEFIKIAKKYDLETKPDGVDDKPEYQIDVLDTGVINKELWEKCRLIYLNKLKPIIESTPWIPSDQRINYIFLRRYEKTERTHIPMHTDDSYITMSFLLSDTKDFEGGELYVFDSKDSIEIDNWDDKFYTPTSNREKFVNSHPNLPILDYQQGDLAVYTGGKNYHGILPITSGERYILTFFLDKSKINQ
tara:strand:+ start:270 stop:911 length:642 start_codon:yes stop_codon:yes gene_type:complete